MSSNAKNTFTKIKNTTEIMPNIAKNNPTKTKDEDEHPFYDIHNLLDNSPSVDLNYDTNKIEVPVLDSVSEEKLWKAFLSYQYYDDLYDLEQAYNDQPEPVKEEDKNEWEEMFEEHEQLEGTNKESSDLFNSIDEQNDYLSFLESGKLGENLLGFFSKSESDSETNDIDKKEKAKKVDFKKSDIVETQLALYPDFIDESDESKVIRMEDFIRGDPGAVVEKNRYGDQIVKEEKAQENFIQKIQSIKLPNIPALDSFFPTSATSPIVSGISSKFPKYNISDFVSTTYDSYSISNPIKINSKNRDRLGLQKLGYSPKFRKNHAKNGNGNRGSKVIFTVFKKNPNLHNHENGDVLNQKDLPTETILLGILLLLLIYCSTCFLTKLYYIRRNYLIILKNNKKKEEKIRKYGIVDQSRHLTINETSVETLQTSQNLTSSENSNFLNGTTTTLTVPNPTTDDSQLSKNSRISVKSIAVVLENIKKASQFSLKHDLQTELIRSQTGIICEKTICGLLDHDHKSSDLSGHNHIGQCCNSNLIRNHFRGRIIAAQQEFDL